MEITLQAIYPSPGLAQRAIQYVERELGGTPVEVLFRGDEVKTNTGTSRVMYFIAAGVLFGVVAGGLFATLFPIGDGSVYLRFAIDMVFGALAGGIVAYWVSLIMMASVMGAEARDLDTSLEQGDVAIRVTVDADTAPRVSEILASCGSRRSDGTPGVDRSDEVDTSKIVA